MNPYQRLVAGYVRLATEGKSLPLGGFPPPARRALRARAPKALIFSPHPDDECIVGGLPLRLLREAGMRVINVAVTLGTNPARQAERRRELGRACRFLGFGLAPAASRGLENISRQTRREKGDRWDRPVQVIAGILAEHKPRVIFFPHARDRHPAHIGTHFLVMDALRSLPADFGCVVVETEYWGAMEHPNLMVESSAEEVGDLMAATSFHAGEVRRHPFHLRQPAWMEDNARRGSELVGGQGAAGAAFQFATLYRLRQWRRGELREVFQGGRLLASQSNAGELLAPS